MASTAGTFELIRERKGKRRITACTHAYAEKMLRLHVASVAETMAMMRANPLGVVRLSIDTVLRYNPRSEDLEGKRALVAGEYPPQEVIS